MADQETEQEWAKSKRIEAEKMKAARALANMEPDKANLTFLDPKTTKVKGWSSDPDVKLASIERMGNRAIILVLGGIILSIIGYVGGIVTVVSNLGLAGVIISSLPSCLGMLLIGIGIIMSLVTIGAEVTYKIKSSRKFSSSFWTAIGALALVGLYWLITWLVV